MSLFHNVAPPLLSQSDPPWPTHLDTGPCADDVAPLPGRKDDRQIRRRSSKACDQCRKSKCKCERHGAADEPCKNCVLLATPCTFLGPSRKRGPPKGYIDAIESRLHQLEALVGTLLSSDDPRARSLLQDLAGDPLARDILQRVDESPFGRRPKRHAGDTPEDRASRIVRTSPRPGVGLPFPSPSTQWQDHLKGRLQIGAAVGAYHNPHLSLDASVVPVDHDPDVESPRQRLRLHPPYPQSHSSPSHSSLSAMSEEDEEEEDLASAVGQLSLNEDSQVRYHGKASGLHILGQSDRLDKRNEGGIWRFPRAGVWPRASHTADHSPRDLASAEEDARAHFPASDVQQELLALYFAYVHPVLPLMHQAQFRQDFRPEGENALRVPTLLLTSMFAIAARYRTTPEAPLPTTDGDMWNAGDDYLEHAKRILNQTYASSRPSTCQALLLLSYRQIGIGAMAQAWLYLGMAVRMAQDLGMHRSAEKWLWQRTGTELFTESERQVRKRIWFACVVMDKYVSTYIGRPLSIFERDFDTPHPAEEQAEESELWEECRRERLFVDDEAGTGVVQGSAYTPVPTHIISCFNASASLSSILSNIVETIYAVQLPPSHTRHSDAALLEKKLDKWYLDLPPHLQLATTPAPVPPPHVFTLHMQYWCAVLLLHRPFMRRKLYTTGQSTQEHEAEAETTASCRKAFDLCAMAATKISNTVSKYKDNFDLQRSPAFLTYYVFSASIMHISTLSVRPVDIQAGLGLQRCMDALRKMQIVWPSAGRAWELLHGAKIDMREIERSRQAQAQQSTHEKRKHEQVEGAIVDIARDSTATMQPQPQPQPQTEQFVSASQQVPSFPGSQPFQRWPAQGELGYTPDLADLQNDILLASADPGALFGNISVGPRTADLWTDFPEQFSDPALLASSLYGLPVMSPGHMQGQAQGQAGLPLPFMGGEYSMYNSASSVPFGAQ